VGGAEAGFLVRDAGGPTGSLLEMAAGIGRARSFTLCCQDCFDGAFGRAGPALIRWAVARGDRSVAARERAPVERWEWSAACANRRTDGTSRSRTTTPEADRPAGRSRSIDPYFAHYISAS
jgi:hypothetical protein